MPPRILLRPNISNLRRLSIINLPPRRNQPSQRRRETLTVESRLLTAIAPRQRLITLEMTFPTCLAPAERVRSSGFGVGHTNSFESILIHLKMGE